MLRNDRAVLSISIQQVGDLVQKFVRSAGHREIFAFQNDYVLPARICGKHVYIAEIVKAELADFSNAPLGRQLQAIA